MSESKSIMFVHVCGISICEFGIQLGTNQFLKSDIQSRQVWLIPFLITASACFHRDKKNRLIWLIKEIRSEVNHHSAGDLQEGPKHNMAFTRIKCQENVKYYVLEQTKLPSMTVTMYVYLGKKV